MLYFSKIKLFTIYIIIAFLSFFALTNFIKDKENFFISNQINLGLDLQGGSYLLLQVDTKPLINQRLQSKILKLRNFLKENKIRYKDLLLNNERINFLINDDDIKKL